MVTITMLIRERSFIYKLMGTVQTSVSDNFTISDIKESSQSLQARFWLYLCSTSI